MYIRWDYDQTARLHDALQLCNSLRRVVQKVDNVCRDCLVELRVTILQRCNVALLDMGVKVYVQQTPTLPRTDVTKRL